MSLLGGLGLFPGNRAQVATFPPGGLPVRKPSRSTAGNAFFPAQRLAIKQPQPNVEPPRPDPLYLFYCGLKWHKSGEPASGWELVQTMRSKNRGERALAAELLADTKNGRLLVRDLRRIRSGLSQIARGETSAEIEPVVKGEDMNTPY